MRMKNNYISKKLSDIKLSFIILVLFGFMPPIGLAQTVTFSSSNPAIPAGNLSLGSVNQVIYQASFVQSGYGINIGSLTFTPDGTFSPADISNYKFWWSATNSFSTATPVGASATPSAPKTPITINTYNPSFNNLTPYYVWITVDVSPTAVAGNTLTVGALSPSSFSIPQTMTKTGTMYIGGTQTIGASTGGSNRYSVAPGNWSSTSTWSATSGGTAGASVPAANDAVFIEGNKTVTLDINTASLGSLNIASGSQLTTSNAYTVSATTISLNGNYVNGSTGAITGTMTVGTTGTYQHNINGGTIPTATWNAGSNCTITGITSAKSLAGLSQIFGNFTWNCTSQGSGNFYLASNITTAGDFKVLSTGATNNPNNYSLRMSDSGTSYTINVGGNFVISNSAAFKMNNSTGGCTLNVNGNLNINNGTTFSIVTGNANSTVNVTGSVNIAGTLNMQEEGDKTGTLNVKGNLALTGTLTESANGSGAINFNGTTTQTYSKTGGTISNIINFAVIGGATLNVGTSVINGDGTFTLNSGASIITAHTQGLSKTVATGSIQVTGIRAYNTGANYTYNGAGDQAIGNGLTGANNLTISGGGIKTFTVATNISNIFSINDNVTANLSNFTHTTNTYYLGGIQQATGSWGGSGSGANNKNTTNFAPIVTGILNVTTSCAAGYWKGTTSSDWNTRSNWCDNAIPTSATDVTIPASAPYQPIIGVAGGKCKDITIGTGAKLAFENAVAVNLAVYGNWVNNGTLTITPDVSFTDLKTKGTVSFVGSSLQTIGGNNSTTFYNVTLQNTGGVTLNKPITVTRAILLISGNLNTTSTNFPTVTNTANSGILGGSAFSYINGPVQWNLPSNMTTSNSYNYKFPVGNTSYLPYTLVNPVTGSNPTAKVEAVSGTTSGTPSAPLTSLSTTEYWKLTTSNFTSTSVTLGKGDVDILPNNVVAVSPSETDTYTSLGGTSGYYEVSNSNSTNYVNNFFKLATTNTPTINISPVVLGGFGYIFNFGPSPEQIFIVNGTSLTDNITITAPTEFEISITPNIGFVQSITLNMNASNKVSIYIRLKAGLAIGNYDKKTITIVSGSMSFNINASGTVFATTPAINTGGGLQCPPATGIELSSSSDDINILYWTGPDNFYSQEEKPIISAPLDNKFGLYTVTGSLPTGPNLIVNGTFEDGNVGFLSDYAYTTSLPDYDQGTYAIIDDAKTFNGNFKGTDSEDAGTKQMVIDGATIANVTVWSQTVKVVPYSNYQFTYYLQNVFSKSPSILQLFANNQPVGNEVNADAGLGIYKKYYYNWYSGPNTSVLLDLRNQNTIADGNDFALDNIDFRTVTQVSSSVNVTNDNVAGVAITASATTVTQGTSVVYTATPQNGGTAPMYQWYVNNVAVGTNSIDPVFNYVPKQGDVIKVMMDSNKDCVSGDPATSNLITMTVNGQKNYWIGNTTAGGTVWSDASNWTENKVPATGDDVEFATATNPKGAAKNDLCVDFSRRIGNLINTSSGKNLIIPADKQVVVNNLVINTPAAAPATKYEQIQILADASSPNGSLIFYNTDAVYATVEMWSKANIVAGGATDQKYFWQYFGIPVETLDADPTLYGAYVRRSNEAGTDQDENYYWKELGTYDKLTKFLGYEICQPAAKKYTFTGQLVNTDLDSRLLPEFTPTGGFLPVSNNGSSVDGIKVKYPGEHLFANAYTAAINVDKIEFGSALDKTVFLYNTGSYGQWVSNTGGSTGGTAEGQYLSIPQNVAGFSGIPGQIPSMSSFLVKTGEDKTANSYIKINYKNAVFKNSTLQRVKSIDAISNTDLISTRIDLTGQHYSDRMWIFTEPSCTRNFDNGWDGRKMLGSSLAPQIFAVEPDGDYQVNSVSDMHDTDLAFQAGDEVEYTLKFTHENIQRQYAGVYLVDLVENKTVDVTQNGSTYTFATAQSDAPTKRFKILTRSYEKGAPDKEAQVKIFTAPGRVFVHNLSTSKGECTLYDIAGRAIKNASFAANAVTEVLNNLTPGAYVVNTITNGEKVSKRVIVQ